MLDNRSFSPESFSSDSWYFGDAPGAIHPSWGVVWGGSWGNSWGPLHEVYEPLLRGGPDGRDDSEDEEKHLEARRKVGEKLYAKPVEIVKPASIVEAQAPLPAVAVPVVVAAAPVDLSPHKQDLALLSEELSEIQQTVATLANEAIAKARRREEEEFLLLFM